LVVGAGSCIAYFHAPILRLTYATSKPLISWVKKTVAKLTLCATSGKKIGGGFEVYIVLSNVFKLLWMPMVFMW
jgi:hypothetical protein